MSVRTPKMARPAPRKSRDLLSAGSLLRHSSLQPIIASRSGDRFRDMDESTARSDVANRYEDRSSIAPGYRTRTIEDFLNSERQSLEPVREMALVPYGTYPAHRERAQGQASLKVPPGHRGARYGYNYYHGHHGGRVRRRPARERNKRFVAPTCYIFLKVFELSGVPCCVVQMVCIALLVVSRVFHEDLTLDYVYSIFAAIALLAAGIGLLLAWVRGHPVPDDCVHTTMLMVYSIVIPVLLCGGILVLLLADLNSSVAIVASLFFISTFLFTVDIAVMAASILQCQCCGSCCCIPPFPPRPHRIYPNTYPNVYPNTYPNIYPNTYPDSYRNGYYSHNHHHGYARGADSHRPHTPRPYDNRGHHRNGYPGYPRSLPQMSVWS